MKTRDRGKHGSGWEEFMDGAELSIPGFENPAKIGEAVARPAPSDSPAWFMTKLGVAIGLTGAAFVAADKLYHLLISKIVWNLHFLYYVIFLQN